MSIKGDVFGDKGYSTDLKLHEGELGLLESCIKAQFEETMWDKYVNLRNCDIGDYHLHQVEHASLWIKKSRILSPLNVEMIKQLNFMKVLENEFGPFKISNEERIYPEEIYWWIVRPYEMADVGTLHADRWFWDLGHGKKPGKQCVKIWIPIRCQPGHNGLKVVPGSHKKKDWKYHGEHPSADYRAHYMKPVIDESEEDLKPIPLMTEPGRCVIFNEDLLHGGMFNAGTQTRISLEFLIYNDGGVE